MNTPNVNKIAEHYTAILNELGADLSSEGMRETPMRAAKGLNEMTEVRGWTPLSSRKCSKPIAVRPSAMTW